MGHAQYYKKLATKSGVSFFLESLRTREPCAFLLCDRAGTIIAPATPSVYTERFGTILDELGITDLDEVLGTDSSTVIGLGTETQLVLFPVGFPRNDRGALAIIHDAVGQYAPSEGDMAFFANVAHLLSSVLEKLGTGEIPLIDTDRPDSFTLDSTFIGKLSEASTLPTALQRILSHLTLSTEIDAVAFARVDDQLKQILPLYQEGFNENIFAHERTQQLLNWEMCKSPEPLSETFRDIEGQPPISLKALALYPVLNGDEVVARMIFGSHKVRTISTRTKGLAESLTQMLGVTMARIHAQQAMEESDVRYRMVFEKSTDALMLLNASHFIECNEASLTLFKVDTREAFCRLHPSDLSPVFQPDGSSSWQKSVSLINQALEQGSMKFYWKHMRTDGTEFDAEVWLTSFSHRGERVIQATVRDISEILHNRKEIEEARDKLEKTNKGLMETLDHTNRLAYEAHQAVTAKNRFLAKIAHELRTPMSGIIGMGELLQDTRLDRTQREYVSTIVNSASSLIDILNDLSDFSSLEEGLFPINPTPFMLRTLLDDISSVMGITAHEKGLEFLTFLDPQIPERLIGDPLRLRQVLLNITGNAIKFTLVGQVALRATLLSERDDCFQLLFSIKDTGVGIPQETVDLLLGAETPAEELPQPFGGTGLGLSITKQLLSRMGAEITVTTAPGKGTDFQFTLDLKMDIGDEEDRFEDIDGKRVIVVDPKRGSRENLAEQLSAFGAQVFVAPSTMVALEKATQVEPGKEPFSLIVVVESREESSTRELLRYLREDRVAKEIPILLVTDPGITMSDRDLDELGVRAQVVKPLKSSTLQQAIRVSLLPKRSHTTQPLKALSKPGEGEPDYSRFNVLVVEDNRINQKVAVRILSRLGIVTKIARTGLEALEILGSGAWHLILMDVELPIMDGIEATVKIRMGECGTHNRNIPIIGMTGYTMDNVLERCIKSGMNGYITKPLRPLDLQKILSTYLK